MQDYIEWGYWGLFLASFMAATLIPLSSEIVLSFLIANQYDFLSCISIATFGNWLGGMSSYGLGRLANWNVLERFFGVKQVKVMEVRKYSERWGSSLAFFCWLPVVGDVFAVGLGVFQVSISRVAIWMLFGKMIRYILWSIFTLWGIGFI
jgi:membrane protein YqaA with SNARE-associated domain